MSPDAALEAYLNEAASWDADRATQRERSTRIAWRIAALATALWVLSMVTLLMLMPLRRVEPFVIRVDNTTGIVDVVPVFAGKTSMQEVVTRYLLDHYVTVCERFNFATAESDYEECGAFHSAARNQAWFSQWDRTNPASPLNVYKDGTSVRAQVGAVSFFTRANGLADLAQVRYTKAQRAGSGAADQITHWIATIQYAYADASKDPRVRRWNPLGFKVLEFRAEPEVLPADTPASSSVPVAATGPSAALAVGRSP